METPYYKFSLNKIDENYNNLRKNINADKFFYALKSNSEERIIEHINDLNLNFEIASIEELKKLQSINVSSDRIICSLPIKTEKMIRYLYESGVNYFVFDNIDEFKKIKCLIPNANLVLRININDIIPYSIEYGMEYFEFLNYLGKEIKKDEIYGITFYISKNKDIDNLIDVLNYSERFLKKVCNCKVLNIGGNYRLSNEVEKDFYSKLNSKLRYLKDKYKLKVYVEPGRSFVKSSGSLVTEVQCVKNLKNYVYIDAGSPTGISYEPKTILNLTRNKKIEKTCYFFYDITCSHRLLFVKEIDFEIKCGDVLEFLDFGSYSICKFSNFHSWEKPICIYKY